MICEQALAEIETMRRERSEWGSETPRCVRRIRPRSRPRGRRSPASRTSSITPNRPRRASEEASSIMDPFETKVVRGVTLRKDPAREPCFTVADTDDQDDLLARLVRPVEARAHPSSYEQRDDDDGSGRPVPVRFSRRALENCAWSSLGRCGTRVATSWDSIVGSRSSEATRGSFRWRISSGRSPPMSTWPSGGSR